MTAESWGSQQDGQPSVSNAAVLGEIIWLLSHSSLHKDWPIGSIQQWVFPALQYGQFRVYHQDQKPVGFVTWALLSKEVEEAYVLNTASLLPPLWQSGDRGWLIDYVAPFGHAKDIAHDLKYRVFANNMGRYLRHKEGSDTLNIRYLHGAKVADQAQDWKNNPTVELGKDEGKPNE